MAASGGSRSDVARVLLRLPRSLHRELAREAVARGLSFNEWCVRRLGESVPAGDDSALRSTVVARAREIVGDHLAGVLLLGSWARGDHATSSDIDVLIVVDPGLPLTRDRYREWDRAPLEWDGRPVDVHLTHLAPPGAPPTTAWCEAAVDGQVWYDRGGVVGRRLAEIRRAMAEGRVVRATAHGQPYWKGVA